MISCVLTFKCDRCDKEQDRSVDVDTVSLWPVCGEKLEAGPLPNGWFEFKGKLYCDEHELKSQVWDVGRGGIQLDYPLPKPEIVSCKADENAASITDLRTGKVYPAAM
jgi:hypothetical protein